MNDQALIADAVYQMVTGLSSISCGFEELPADATRLPCLSVQTLTGNPIVSRYKNGGYVGAYRFAVYLRQSATDTASRLDAVQTLTDLAVEIDNAEPTLPEAFDFWGIKQDTLPVRVDVDASYDDWQATFTLQYKKG